MFLKSLLITGPLTAAAAIGGSVATGNPQSRWFRRLRKPAIQPPSAVFPVVWTALYTDIALTSAAVLSARRGAHTEKTNTPTGNTEGTTDAAEPVVPHASRGYLLALIINLVLNASWSVVFFRLHKLGPSVLVAVALAASSTDLARRAGKVRPAYGWALSAYAAWCTFAAVLSNRIRVLNR